jgi:hypothetical protein
VGGALLENTATEILTTNWNTLNVYVSRNADVAVFSINGAEVGRIANSETVTLPSISNGQSTAANCFSVGAEIQSVATLTSAKTLTIDFMRFRYFHNRS